MPIAPTRRWAAALSFVLGTQAGAATVVDTGPSSQTTSMWVLDETQWLAARFSLVTPHVISSVEGWISRVFADGISQGGTVTAVIYSDGGQVPGTELFSTTFAIPDGKNPDWYGAAGLTWSLPAGNHWAAFEVRAGQTFRGGMPNGVPAPLSDEASARVPAPYGAQDGLRIGVRIAGEPLPVPEPLSAVLLLAGLALIGCARRLHRR